MRANVRPPERLLYPIPEAAYQLGISRSKAYEIIARGDLKVVRLDGSVRVTSDELQRFVESLKD